MNDQDPAEVISEVIENEDYEIKEIGIVALRQITNERLWYEVMNKIRDHFIQEDFCKILPNPKTVFNKNTMKILELTEHLNFWESGLAQIQWQWIDFWQFFTPDQKVLLRKKEIQFKQTLAENMETISFNYRKHLQAASSTEEFFSFDMREFGQIYKAVQILEECDEETVQLILDGIEDYERPLMFTFNIGLFESSNTNLPLFGRHFTNFIAKVVAGSESEKVVKTVYEFLHYYFPDHVYFWDSSSLNTDANITYYRRDFVDVMPKDAFYRKASDIFDEDVVTDVKSMNRLRLKVAQSVRRRQLT